MVANGITIHYREEGGPSWPGASPVLILPGWGVTIDSMAITPLIEFFSQNFRVIAIDFPGHGGSSRPPTGGWGVDDFVTCIQDVIHTLCVMPPIIIAHSFGGRVAIKLAALRPDLTGPLILIDGAGVAPGYNLQFLRKRLMAKFISSAKPRFSGDGIRDWFYQQVKSDDYIAVLKPEDQSAMKDTYLRVVGEDLTDLLKDIKASTLIFWGDRDQDTPLASAYKMRTLIKRSELDIEKGAGHFSYLAQEGQVGYNGGPLSFRFCLRTQRFLATELKDEGMGSKER